MSKTEPSFELFQTLHSEYVIGQGQIQPLQGRLHWPGHRLEALKLLEPRGLEHDFDWYAEDADESRAEFDLQIFWRADDLEQAPSITLQLIDDKQQQFELELAQQQLLESRVAAISPGRAMGDAPLIAICMATYEPDLSRFTRQIESIICQSYENWILIISDDASGNVDWDDLEAVCRLDPRRIRLIRHQKRFGFYANFERALSYVPDTASMIALADQDDEWYPEKLQRLAERLNAEDSPQLVYSDMRIVDEQGRLLSDSYWIHRKNEYQDFDSIFLNNTMTGAAALFKSELLKTLLPFPEPLGEMFHDHWLACVARSVGKIAYIDAPLYDYYQYTDSVIGHCNEAASGLGLRASRFFKKNNVEKNQQWRAREQAYEDDCLRLQRIADTLKLRLPDQAGNATLNLMNGGVWSAVKLIKTYLKGRLLGRTRGGAELGLAMGFIADVRQKRL